MVVPSSNAPPFTSQMAIYHPNGMQTYRLANVAANWAEIVQNCLKECDPHHNQLIIDLNQMKSAQPVSTLDAIILKWDLISTRSGWNGPTGPEMVLREWIGHFETKLGTNPTKIGEANFLLTMPTIQKSMEYTKTSPCISRPFVVRLWPSLSSFWTIWCHETDSGLVGTFWVIIVQFGPF